MHGVLVTSKSTTIQYHINTLEGPLYGSIFSMGNMMAKRYETGSKKHVAKVLLRCAIQDREALADVHSGSSDEDVQARAEIEAQVRDFERLIETI